VTRDLAKYHGTLDLLATITRYARNEMLRSPAASDDAGPVPKDIDALMDWASNHATASLTALIIWATAVQRPNGADVLRQALRDHPNLTGEFSVPEETPGELVDLPTSEHGRTPDALWTAIADLLPALAEVPLPTATTAGRLAELALSLAEVLAAAEDAEARRASESEWRLRCEAAAASVIKAAPDTRFGNENSLGEMLASRCNEEDLARLETGATAITRVAAERAVAKENLGLALEHEDRDDLVSLAAALTAANTALSQARAALILSLRDALGVVAGRGQATRNQISRTTTGAEAYVRRNKAADRLLRRDGPTFTPNRNVFIPPGSCLFDPICS
jgi:hypothetical protein